MLTGLLIAALCGVALADDALLETNIFGSMYFHNPPEYNEAKLVGTVIGWIVFVAILVIVAAMLIVEMVEKHTELQELIAVQERRMRELGVSMEKVEVNFQKL